MENVKVLNSAIEITMSDMIAIPKDELGGIVKRELGRKIGELISKELTDLPVEFYSEGVNPCSGSETYRLRVWIHNKEYLKSIEQKLHQTLCQNAKLHEELKVYKADAELGRVVRKAFQKPCADIDWLEADKGIVVCKTVEQLLEWAKEVENES